MLKKLIKLNLDDLALYLGVEGGLFLLIQIVIGCVMYFGRPTDSITVSCILFPIVGGFCALIAGISHVGVSFDQALRFGQTRRRALGLTLGLASFETVFALALAAVLTVVERVLCVPLWARLAGLRGWRLAMDIIPGGGRQPENILLVDTFSLDWYWWLLIFVLAVGGGMIAGAVIQRFGAKGGWFIWGICFAPMLLEQILPWEAYGLTHWLIPTLGLLFAAGSLWSVWSLLHASVRS